jgi:rod shape determining protein RodA
MTMLQGKLSERASESFDWALFIVAVVIAAFGIANLISATSVYTQSRAELWVTQFIFLALGSVLAFAIVAIDYRHIERIAYLLYGSGILSLLLVMAVGKDIRGSKRWIDIGPFGFQPSEFTKLGLVLALAKYIHDSPRSDAPRGLRDLLAPAALAAVPFLLVLKQPDLGTALIHGLIFVSIVALVRVRWQSLVGLVIAGAVAAPIAYSRLETYQLKRIESFLNPESDVTGAGYHAYNAKVAIGNGGVFGQGYGQGTQNQFYFLPDQFSDFPFPVFAEDWGFLGCTVLIILYAFLVVWAVRIASQAKDRFGAVVAIGVGAMIFWHAFFNLGMVTGILPVVGVTLPLFSYGGSSILTILMGLGLLMNVSMRRPHVSAVRGERVLFAR